MISNGSIPPHLTADDLKELGEVSGAERDHFNLVAANVKVARRRLSALEHVTTIALERDDSE